MAEIDFVKDVSEASDNDDLTLGVVLELSKAFDTICIDRRILLDKLFSRDFSCMYGL